MTSDISECVLIGRVNSTEVHFKDNFSTMKHVNITARNKYFMFVHVVTLGM